MDPWILATWLAGAGFLLTCLLCTGTPIARPLTVLAWACAVFTAEAALAGAGDAPTGTLTVPKLLPLALLAATSGWFLLQPQRGPAFNDPLRWAVWYVSWLTVTALFAPDPVSGLLRAAQIGLPLAVILAVRRAAVNASALVLATVLGCAAHVVYAVVIHPGYVGVAGQQRLTGLLIANTFGLAAGLTIAGAFGLWLARVGKPGTSLLLWALIGLGVYAIVESEARTAAIAVLVALIASIAAARGAPRSRVRPALAGGLVVAAAVYVAFQPQLYQSALRKFSGGNNDLSSLTGRLPLWRNLLPAIADHPILGFGPAAYRDESAALSEYLSPQQLELQVAHNALLEALVAGGLLAGLLWLCLMVSAARLVWRTQPTIRPVAVGLFVVSAVSALTTSSAAGIGIGWFVLLALAALPAALPAAEESQETVPELRRLSRPASSAARHSP